MGEGKILIIDDDDNTRNAYRDLFIGHGFETQVIENEQGIFSLLQSNDYEAILLDLRISGDTLIEIAGKIKKEFPKICLFVMFVDLTPAMIKKTMKMGIDDSLVKPVLPMQLIANIRKGVLRYRLEKENSRLAQKFKNIENQLIIDMQIGVYNSQYFNKRLDSEINRAKRHEHWLSVLLCDFDQPHKENEGLLQALDLEAFAKILMANMRTIDIIARYKNGLGIILPETTQEGCSMLCGRLKQNLDKEGVAEVEVRAQKKSDVRFGIATYPFDSHLPKKLLRIAEERLQ